MDPSSTIAHYRIVAKLGEGGMGAVYRATDTKLNRDVAIKVLPESFADDPDRLARFTREAQVLASLNHPNIAAIYGVEDRAIVLELVEGPDLAGPLSEEQALPIIDQLIGALEYAHEKGIVHRDLKPANLKLTSDGRLKVLDFGLAKALAADSVPDDPASSSTLTMHATLAGVIMGTAAYMSPEQARGQNVDKRADIWSFGVIVYELLTGKHLFAGETVTDTLAAVLKTDLDLSSVPPRFRRLVRLCLTRDPRQRLRDISGARLLLEDAAPATPGRRASKLPWVLAAIVAGTAILAAILGIRAFREPLRPLIRVPIDLAGEGGSLSLGKVAVSPDGRRIAYAIRGSSASLALEIRQFDQAKPRVVPDSQRADNPFFSPDGQWVGFFGLGRLAKVNVEGGFPITLTSVVGTPVGNSATWGPDGTIVFSENRGGGGLLRVPDSGGEPKLLTDSRRQGQLTLQWPQFLPGGKAVLFTAHRDLANFDDAEIDALNLRTGEWKTVQKGGYFGRYLPSGHLVYVRQGTLFAVRFDPGRLETSGQPVPVMTDMAANPGSGDGRFECSSDAAGPGFCTVWTGLETNLVYNAEWIDESANSKAVFPRQQVYTTPRLSPDGRLLAVSIGSPNGDIHIWDTVRESLTQLTFTRNNNQYPIFTPDGRHLVYTAGANSIWWTRVDGSGAPQKLYESAAIIVPSSFSPDGRLLAYFTVNRDTRQDLWMLPIDTTDPEQPKPGDPQPFLVTPNGESSPVFSPDGRWVAYNSDESGASELYVRPFHTPAATAGGKWLISSGGGFWASWSSDGKRLFYVTRPDGRIMAVDYTVNGDAFVPGKPRDWRDARGVRPRQTYSFRNWDMSADGRRAVVLAESEGAPQSSMRLYALFNFFDELKRKVP